MSADLRRLIERSVDEMIRQGTIPADTRRRAIELHDEMIADGRLQVFKGAILPGPKTFMRMVRRLK